MTIKEINEIGYKYYIYVEPNEEAKFCKYGENIMRDIMVEKNNYVVFRYTHMPKEIIIGTDEEKGNFCVVPNDNEKPQSISGNPKSGGCAYLLSPKDEKYLVI